MKRVSLIILFLIFGCKEKEGVTHPSNTNSINEKTNCYYWIYTKDQKRYPEEDGFTVGSVTHIRWCKTNTFWRPEGLMFEYTNDFTNFFRLGIR